MLMYLCVRIRMLQYNFTPLCPRWKRGEENGFLEVEIPRGKCPFPYTHFSFRNHSSLLFRKDHSKHNKKGLDIYNPFWQIPLSSKYFLMIFKAALLLSTAFLFVAKFGLDYSRNEIRKTQNERLIMVCLESKVNFFSSFFGVCTTWFFI